jgi:hypothetical protein
VEDFFCSLLFYPLVISQISAQVPFNHFPFNHVSFNHVPSNHVYFNHVPFDHERKRELPCAAFCRGAICSAPKPTQRRGYGEAQERVWRRGYGEALAARGGGTRPLFLARTRRLSPRHGVLSLGAACPTSRAPFKTRAHALQEVLVQAFETAEPPPAVPGLDPGAGYDAEKPYARDLYPFSPGPAEPSSTFPSMPQPAPAFASARPPYSADPTAGGAYGGPYGGASPPPFDVARPGQQSAPGTLAAAQAAYASSVPPGPYSNWRSAGAGPQAPQGNPGPGFGYGAGYGPAGGQDPYQGWAGGTGAGGYDSARNAEAGRWYPPDAYQGVA